MASPAIHPVLEFKRILALISLTEGSRETLMLALELAKKHGAEVVLLHVIDLNLPEEELGMPRVRMLSLLHRDAEKELHQLVQMANPKVATKVLVCEGTPMEVVQEQVIALAPDIIVTCPYSAQQLCRT